MTITSVNTWGIGDELTSPQLNDIDTNTTSALDKRAAQTDTLESVVSLAGAGRIVQTLAVGANADTTYLVSGGNLCIRVTSAVTANRNYTLSNTNALMGDAITVYCEPSFVTYEIQIKDNAAVTLYTLGNLVSSEGAWASFVFTGAAWVLAPRGQGLRTRVAVFSGSGTFAQHAFGCPPRYRRGRRWRWRWRDSRCVRLRKWWRGWRRSCWRSCRNDHSGFQLHGDMRHRRRWGRWWCGCRKRDDRL